MKNLGMTTLENTSGFLTTNVSPLVVQHARSGSSASQAVIILNVLARNTGSWPLMSSARRRGWARMVYSPHVGIVLSRLRALAPSAPRGTGKVFVVLSPPPLPLSLTSRLAFASRSLISPHFYISRRSRVTAQLHVFSCSPTTPIIISETACFYVCRRLRGDR